ncbi:MAG: hypothetical protein ICCCNLDF_01666 [Planctomycetes bacterium]|nr:hypothetical protein [Planctomycetota bacterium]
MGRLQPGERLLLADGSEAVVETLEREYAPAVFENWTPGQAATGTLGTPADPTTGTFTTYNFEVADWHTYFAAHVWVHNEGRLCDKALDRLADVYRRRPGSVEKMNLSPDELEEVVKRAKGGGRAGKQDRLRELAEDPNISSADRGWIENEMRQIEFGNRDTIRNPPGKDLAHERGREAAKGYSYKYSNLQDRDLHRLQHKFDDFGRANPERTFR